MLFSFYHKLPTKPEEKFCLAGLHGSSQSFITANLIQHVQKPILIITNDLHSAARLEEEMHFFASQNSSATLPILSLPDWETLPYDRFSPHQDIISQRLLTLYQLANLTKGVVITAINTLMHRLPPHEHIMRNSFVLNSGDNLDITNLRQKLEKHGYYCVNKVMEHGEFAVRGSIIDIFPMGSTQPYRIDLLDQEVESIRLFDIETQRSSNKIDKIRLLPAKEFPLDPQAITTFRQNWRNVFAGDPSRCPIYESISNGQNASGIEYYLPLFFDHTYSLIDYLPKDTLVILLNKEGLAVNAINFWQEINTRYQELHHDYTRPLLPPTECFWTPEQITNSIEQFPQLQISNKSQIDSSKIGFTDTAIEIIPASALPDLTVDHKSSAPLAKIAAFLQANETKKVLFCAESAGRRESLLELLATIKLLPSPCASWVEFVSTKNTVNITTAPLEQGFMLMDLIVITEANVFGRQIVPQKRLRGSTKPIKTIAPENIIQDLTELNIGAPVVHIEHGVGRYLGLQTIISDEIPREFLTLEYANNAKLYVPISALHLISRYTGADADNAPIYNLGSNQWEKAKRKAIEKIRDVAAELLELYAKRAARPGFVFKILQPDYQKFISAFPFEETPDQQSAIADVIKDMTSPHHMERLICGDVGFGKTEVAMRAAFIASSNNKQVIILSPTTILAQQHYLNFKDRFADWPIRIEIISRFRSAKEQATIIQQLAEGKIDIIIGTHKLLQPNIKFKDLGLLIIDEEHRFGVKQKERLKELRPDVDVLTLTATPIPRTLNMSLAGIRDFSLITTPPLRRLAIKTFLYERDNNLIREAILREILRGGQVYFLHNNVATIEKVTHELQNLIPNAKIAFAHGQMREHQLEKIMSDFYHMHFNILVSTTIIESGIDVPTANTIIIDRADRFGLAQLHQLRGRVGRSHHQAYAYLLVTSKHALTQDAEKRLEAITAMEDLGAGFNLATHDLEIRGAGELLGEEQSGQIEGIGFSLYMEYLQEAITALKAGKEPAWDDLAKQRIEIDIKIPTLFPDDYINDVHLRLTLYKRIANAKNDLELIQLREEIIDRFGVLPEASKNLFRITALKLVAEQLGVHKITAGVEGGIIEFTAKPNVEAIKIIRLIQQQPQLYKLRGSNKLEFKVPQDKINNTSDKNIDKNKIASTCLQFLEQLLKSLCSFS